MTSNRKNIEETLVKGLSHILRRTIEVNEGDQLAIAQEYREWINCITAEDFSRHEILVIDKNRFC